MASSLLSLLKVVIPTRTNPKGTASTSTFNPSNSANVLTIPAYRDHLTDIFTTRQSSDSRALLKTLFVQDPDVGAAVNAFLTVANTEPRFVCRDIEGVIDREAQKDLQAILVALTTRFDYKAGFELRPSLRAISENMRYMVLLRGALASELILNKQKLPTKVRLIDAADLEWFETEPGNYKPQQAPPGSSDKIPLDVPTVFVSHFRRDPTSIYSNSPFVSSINTVAARQQVVNDLYRIMKFTGFPRIELTVVEEVLLKNAPASIANDESLKANWVSQQIASLSSQMSTLEADQAFVHTDSIEAKILNDKNPASGLNISGIIETLNAQNQAALRTMSTILGRGESGVNTASVEALLFSKTADEINEPVGEIWSQMLTMAIRIAGHLETRVECTFDKAEMRPDLELEAQKLMRQNRLQNDLSLGVIDDDEYHMALHGRIRPDTSPILSGTNFLVTAQAPDDGTQPTGVEKAVTPGGGEPAGSGA